MRLQQHPVHQPFLTRDAPASATLAIQDPSAGNTVYAPDALAIWKTHMQQHLTDNKPAPTVRYIAGTTARTLTAHACTHTPDRDQENRADDESSPTLTSGSESPVAMNERRARIGPCKHTLAEQISSDEEETAATLANNAQQCDKPVSTPSKSTNL